MWTYGRVVLSTLLVKKMFDDVNDEVVNEEEGDEEVFGAILMFDRDVVPGGLRESRKN